VPTDAAAHPAADRAGERAPELRPTVAVVGGGISGLVAAWRLVTAPDAPRVVVLEAGPRFGGVLRVGDVGPVEVDLGAESLLARRPEAVDLVRELGLGDRLVHPATTTANVVRAGRLLPMPAGTLMGVPADPGSLHGLLTPAEVERVAAERERPAEPVGADVDVASWVAGRVGRAVVDRLVEPLLGGVYAGHADRLSLQATVPALWRWARSGGSLLDGVAATLRESPGTPVFAGIEGGVGRLPEVLADRLRERGADLRTRTTVRGLERVERPAGGATGDREGGREGGRPQGSWRLLLGPAPAGGVHHAGHLDVDAVVLAVPARAASRLLAGPCPAASTALAGVEAASVGLVVAVVDRQALAGLPGSGVLVPPVERRAVKAMTFASAKWGWVDRLDPDRAVVRLSLGRHGEEAVLQRDDADLAALALADAADLLARPLAPVAVRVVRWGGALPQPAVGHVVRIAGVRAALAGVPGLALAGAALDGVGVPACIAAAGRAAADVLAGLPGRSRATAAAG